MLMLILIFILILILILIEISLVLTGDALGRELVHLGARRDHLHREIVDHLHE